MNGFFVRNLTGVPVHARVDEERAKGIYVLTLSLARINGNRPLFQGLCAPQFGVVPARMLPIPHLAGLIPYQVNDKIGLRWIEVTDDDGDRILQLDAIIS